MTSDVALVRYRAIQFPQPGFGPTVGAPRSSRCLSLPATPSPALDFPAGKIVNLAVDLDAHTAAVEGTDDPSAHGCP